MQNNGSYASDYEERQLSAHLIKYHLNGICQYSMNRANDLFEYFCKLEDRQTKNYSKLAVITSHLLSNEKKIGTYTPRSVQVSLN